MAIPRNGLRLDPVDYIGHRFDFVGQAQGVPSRQHAAADIPCFIGFAPDLARHQRQQILDGDIWRFRLHASNFCRSFIGQRADRVAHRLMKPGMVVYEEVVNYFGSQILLANGEISRPVLGQIIFENPEQRNVLNGLVHPAIRNELTTWITEKRNNGVNAAVQIPLLYESGMENLDLDAVICVSSSEELMLKRLEKRGLSHEEAEKRIESQMPVSEKEKRSDAVIHNQGTLEEREGMLS